MSNQLINELLSVFKAIGITLIKVMAALSSMMQSKTKKNMIFVTVDCFKVHSFQ